jgi:hypothetical protein
MGAEAQALCNAPNGARRAERTNSRNGYRALEWDTRTGTIEVGIPKLPAGSYFPDWLLERRRRAERALTTVVATCYLLGVSTRRMERLVETLGITRLSKSQVSVMARELDGRIHSATLPGAPASTSLPKVMSRKRAFHQGGAFDRKIVTPYTREYSALALRPQQREDVLEALFEDRIGELSVR